MNLYKNLIVMKRISLVILTVLMMSPILLAQEKQSRREMKKAKKEKMAQQVQALVESKDYTFLARSATTMRGKTIQLTGGYNLTVKNDSATAYLPFFGVAYAAGYGTNDSGIEFDNEMSNYRYEMRKKSHDIFFEARSSNDNYRVHLSVSPSGYASLNVDSNNRQGMRFNGVMKGLGL